MHREGIEEADGYRDSSLGTLLRRRLFMVIISLSSFVVCFDVMGSAGGRWRDVGEERRWEMMHLKRDARNHTWRASSSRTKPCGNNGRRRKANRV